MHVLIITDNLNRARFIQNGFRYENLSADIFLFKKLGSELKNKIHTMDGVVIFISDMSLVEDLVEFCHKIRQDFPVSVLCRDFHLNASENNLLKQRIGNFYIRPFPFRLIVSEIRAGVFQMREKFKTQSLCLRELRLNRETHEISIKGKIFYLRQKEFALLEFLMLHTGRVLSRETILENVWDRNANIFTNTVDVHINKLRKKIHVSDTFIRTIHCSGYLIA